MKTRSALTVSVFAAMITLGACGANNSTTVSNPSTSAPAATNAVSVSTTLATQGSASTDSTATTVATVAAQSSVTVDPNALATLDQTVAQVNNELAATDADLTSADSAIARGD